MNKAKIYDCVFEYIDERTKNRAFIAKFQKFAFYYRFYDGGFRFTGGIVTFAGTRGKSALNGSNCAFYFFAAEFGLGKIHYERNASNSCSSAMNKITNILIQFNAKEIRIDFYIFVKK